MNYDESVRYLNSFLNLERIAFTPNNRLWNLDRMRMLLDRGGHPDRQFLTVLIAGTKGKGSTGFFLESLLSAAGVTTGFYSSPHLVDPRERIRLNGNKISRRLWVREMEAIRRLLHTGGAFRGKGDLTYFEMMTFMAARLFAREGVAVGIFEIGMGGRLDATNAMDPDVAVITPVALDHQEVLGHTLAKIAAEKAAIMRPGIPVVVSPQRPPAAKVIRREARRLGAKCRWIRGPVKHPLGLAGDFQRINAAAALEAAPLILDQTGGSRTALEKGLLKTNWPGRFQIVRKNPRLILDAAHNPASAAAFSRSVKPLIRKKGDVLVFGVSREKNSATMLRSFARVFDRIVVTAADNPRSKEPESLMMEARGLFREVYPVARTPEALRLARILAGTGTVVATGSFYILGEVLRGLK